jgi:broad specificity phosphatase PhoE
MVQIFLVRHGQANSEAKDEVSYDKLSPLGKTQAGWLGQYFKKNEFNFDVCFSGTLSRQMRSSTTPYPHLWSNSLKNRHQKLG